MEAPGPVSCISVFNLAHDATEREVHILFSGCPGYLRCAVVPPKIPSNPPYAFVQFDETDNANWAIEHRENTTWNVGSPVVKLELAKRNMPDHYGHGSGGKGGKGGGKDTWEDAGNGAWAGPPAAFGGAGGPPAAFAGGKGYGAPAAFGAAAKRPRTDVWTEGPSTLHVGGWPPSTQQDGLDKLLIARFGTKVSGSILKKQANGQSIAFVRFVSHAEANNALQHLNGLPLGEGIELKASFAKTELNLDTATDVAPAGAPGWGEAGKGHVAKGQTIGGGAGGAAAGYGQWQGYAPQQQGYGGGGKAGGKGYNARVTLHMTNLPENVDEESLNDALKSTFGAAVVGAALRNDGSGRAPVAWVRFCDEATTKDIETQGEVDLNGHPVTVGYARNELDVNKMRPIE